MIDIQILRDNPELVRTKSAQKQIIVDVEAILKLDAKRLSLLKTVEDLRQQRNQNAETMKASASVKPDQEHINQGKQIKLALSEKEAQLVAYEQDLESYIKAIPNLALDYVPVGDSEDENVESKKVGTIPEFDFEPLSHAIIAERKGWLDKERAAKVAGARFAYIKGDLARLQFAIINFVMDRLTDESFIHEVVRENGLSVSAKPFVPVLPPLMIRTDLYDAMDRLEPRDDRYQIAGEELWLQGSAEHVLGSMHAGEVFDEADLPLRYLGYATSFRKEAGTYGKDMDGMFRMHQFDKLEMESLTIAEAGLDEHKLLIGIQEKLTNLLGIPYRVLLKCTADIGKPNAAGVDIEMWFPSQGKYRETHTADYMTDYQARRLKTRVRRNGSNELIHTNDATAFALSRTPIAIIENYQTKDGNVRIPEVLQPYLGGRTEL